MAVTIYEIAERTGVSASTVSRVLRRTEKETWKSSAKRAAQIRRVAKEMGYRPNLRARAFSERKTMGIGLISQYNDQVFEAINREIVQNITKILGQQGFHLVIVSFDDTSHWQELLLGRRLDGCFLLNFTNKAITDVIIESNLPAVLIGARTEESFPQIESDDYGGAYKAGRHLLGLGHRHLAFYVSEGIRSHYSVDERHRGIEDAVADFGSGAEVEIHMRVAEQDIINSLLERGNRTTAIVSYCDIEAISLAHVLPQYGINIPRDISVIGFNDVFPTHLMSPPLTMVGFDTKQIGESAARTMLGQIAEQDRAEQSQTKSEKMVVDQKVVVRGSTGPAP